MTSGGFTKNKLSKNMNEEQNLLQAATPPLVIPNVRVRFYLKIRRCTNTTNGNGYATYNLEWAWFKKRGSWWFYTQKLGNGDNGERCAS